MGDMADHIMDSQDWWDTDDAPWERPVAYRTCRRCGKEGLVWVGVVKGVWRLGSPDTWKVHECS